MSVGKNPLSDEFERVTKERYISLEGVNAYNSEKEKFKKTLLEKEVAIKVMRRYMVLPEKNEKRIGNRGAVVEDQ